MDEAIHRGHGRHGVLEDFVSLGEHEVGGDEDGSLPLVALGEEGEELFHLVLHLLYWDDTGVWVLAKRLERGRFSWPKPSSERKKLALAPEALALLIGGIELRHGSLKAWYER